MKNEVVMKSKYFVGDVLRVKAYSEYQKDYNMTVKAIWFKQNDDLSVTVEYEQTDENDVVDESRIIGRYVLEKEEKAADFEENDCGGRL